ncbi:Similar to endonuclease/exonuclease/phosphatase family protein [Ogataea parapolymorpha DL-1]; acc. no. EFW96320 [Pyronema omphalodes CBS 100304]|uniref:Similar to endonuclease/exonuclease/phosphatase family protein [Ogataea parapolymorpha DL-1] acc. no. EFW96320 n=1 Tax=Pyronema omphalodes (strain CBS 100304) TaxID=1076935 RepID=U4LTN8_PYROM|nr:Similar to endonuclease/exonuclease/phosphatase family protein [Ogataea parapolymorpha DL-1]; acc. no. EFW96320 [Pyronema omphalodes CBS 100304]
MVRISSFLIFLPTLILTTLATPSQPTLTAVPIRFLTWNLRYDSLPNSIPINSTLSHLPPHLPLDSSIIPYASPLELPWSTRRLAVAREISFNRPDIICFQEALQRQVTDLQELLPGYEHIGVGRDDGKTKGEYEAIFWRRDRVGLMEGDWDTFWLSGTPMEPSKFLGAGSVRSATRGRFMVYPASSSGYGGYDDDATEMKKRSNVTRTDQGKELTVICTHWDDQSDAQRKLAGSLVRMRGAHELATTGNPVFVLGDFNSPRQGVDSGGYQIITGKAEEVKVNETFEYNFGGVKKGWGFLDLAEETHPVGRSGHAFTFTGFKRQGSMDVSRIDFILGSQVGTNSSEAQAQGNGWKVERFRVGENWYDQEGMASDHRPVYADVLVG